MSSKGAASSSSDSPKAAGKRSLAVGVTGNIGSGKTEACRIFQSLGGEVIQADPLAKQIMETDPRVRRSINALFENPVYREDGTLDRKMLARIIFTDDAAKAKIEAIVHPRVIDAIAKEIERHKKAAKGTLLFVESALIYEAEMEEMFDYVVLLESDTRIADERIMARDKMSPEEISLRRSAQLSPEKKIELADFVIYNNGSLQELTARCTLIRTLLAALTTTT